MNSTPHQTSPDANNSSMTSNAHPPNQNYNLTYAGTNFSTHDLPNPDHSHLCIKINNKGNHPMEGCTMQHPFTRYILFDAGHDQLRQIQEGPSTYRANFPALLPGPICFTDASIAPNQGTSQQRAASLGVLITNTQPNETQTITIQGNIGKMSSVIMAEAVAMALAARITRALNLQ